MTKLISKEIQEIKLLAQSKQYAVATDRIKKLYNLSLSQTAIKLIESIISCYKLDKYFSLESLTECKLSEWDNQPIKEGISIVTSCMNRNNNLLKALKTWLRLNVDEIIIVDWSSKKLVQKTLKDINDERIKIVRVENEKRWILTYAFNVGLRFARYDRIYKFDADIEVTPDFLEKNLVTSTKLVRGNWKSAVEANNPEQKFVNGSFAAPKMALKAIGYYNEYIRTYGWDDSDIYQRLVMDYGLVTCFIDPECIYHLEQEQAERLANQSVAKHLFLDTFEPTEFYNYCNKYITALFDDWDSKKLADYHLVAKSRNVYIAKRISTDIFIPQNIIEDAHAYATLKLLSWTGDEIYQSAKFNKQIASLIEGDYRAKIPFQYTKKCILQYSEIVKEKIDKEFVSNKTQNTGVLKSPNISFMMPVIFADKEYLIIPDYDNKKNPVSLIGSNKAVFITSVYDEKNEQRVEDYIYCIKVNFNFFDQIVCVYEETDGTFLHKLKEKLSHEIFSKLIIFKYPLRPTFEFFFELSDLFFTDCFIHISNSDIAVDTTIKLIPEYLTSDKFFVLSRTETTPVSRENSGLILNQLGIANTFSVDMWVYKSPRKYNFKGSFEIGTFHCDSYLNYFISNSGYALYNPCLSINIMHIHDPVFNSSEAKAINLKEKIDLKLQEETKLNGGIPPISGTRWSDISFTRMSPVGNNRVQWTGAVILIPVNQLNLFAVLVLSLLLIHCKLKIDLEYSIWLEVDINDSGDNFYSYLNTIISVVNSTFLHITPKDENLQPLVKTRKIANLKASTFIENLLNTSSYEQEYECFFSKEKNKEGSIRLSSDFNDLDLYKLLKNADKTVIKILKNVLKQLDNSNFTPHLADVECLLKNDKTYQEQLQMNKLQTKPTVSFITSIFKGEVFMKGFLSNIAASAVESNGRVLLIDANSPQNEQKIFDSFINDNKELTPYFEYIRLEKDPGLYNCWKLGIKRSKTEYVSNANLDDRRSPFQATALLNALAKNRDKRAAASGMRANTANNANYYNVLDDQYWFTNGYDEDITFNNLFYTNQEGIVMSHNIMHCMPVWNKSLHEDYGFFDETKYGTSADWAFWLKCTKSGEKFLLVNKVYSQYFINESSHNRTNDADGQKENAIILDYIGINQSAFIQQ